MAQPVILAVDDDPEVLHAVEQDLRQQYRRDYRIVKASSGQDALEAARQLKKRGMAVALMIADQRMPVMSGTDFLNEAQRLHPLARKVLLTAYADTEAAIVGINEIGLDHYLMKPWDPPDQRLYPVLDDLLADWTAHSRPSDGGLRVAGARWSPQSFAIKDFLSRNQVPYTWIDIDQDPSSRELVESLTGDVTTLPVVLFPDGSHLVRPSNADLADKIGMQTHALRQSYDLIIIGGGPAGLAAGVYGGSEGLKTLLLEVAAPGGQAGTSSRIENYLGFPSGVTGADLARRATAQAKRFGVELLDAQEARAIRLEGPFRVVTLADGTEVSCRALVLATGVAVRTLDIPGAEKLTGVGVFYGAAVTEVGSYRDQDIAILGGGNSAGQAALFFARYARTVTIVVRATDLGKSMSQYLVDRIHAAPTIHVRTETEVVGAKGDTELTSLILRRRDGPADEELAVAALFVFIGARPHTDLVADLVARDEKGYIITGLDLRQDGKLPSGWPQGRDPLPYETSVPGIFAVGDVRAGSSKRVAAAVGEGSGVIGVVHQYLELT